MIDILKQIDPIWIILGWPFVGIISGYLLIRIVGGSLTTYGELATLLIFGTGFGYSILALLVVLVMAATTYNWIQLFWKKKLPWVHDE